MKNLILCIVLFLLMIAVFYSCKTAKSDSITLSKTEFMRLYKTAYLKGENAATIRRNSWAEDSADTVNRFFYDKD